MWIQTQVETIGKVYMVVGGAPEKNETHVKDVALGKVCNHNSWNNLFQFFGFCISSGIKFPGWNWKTVVKYSNVSSNPYRYDR